MGKLENSCLGEELTIQLVIVRSDIDEVVHAGGTPSGIIVAGSACDQQRDICSGGFDGGGEGHHSLQIGGVVGCDDGDARLAGGGSLGGFGDGWKIAAAVNGEAGGLKE